MRTSRKPHNSSFYSKNIATLLLTTLVLSGLHGRAQQSQPRNENEAVRRISPKADLSVRETLDGHRPAWSISKNDIGPVPQSTLINLQLLLTRDAVREAAFQTRLADQQDPSSSFFHKWLTPAEIGEMYGPAPVDTAAIVTWLTSQGLKVESVTPSGIFIEFSGPASVVQDTFQTSIHLYRIPGKSSPTKQAWRAPTTEPTIPAAFQPVIAAIEGLAEIPLVPPHHIEVSSSSDPSPLFTNTTGGHSISPSDFATIYDLTPIYNAGINGAGVRIAIIGLSRVDPVDISTYETIFNLPSNPANVVIPTTGGDPGQDTSFQNEATLDVERVVGTAPGAQADLVVSSSSDAPGASGGLITAISYNVQTLLDPIMTISFGFCEVDTGQAMTNFYANLFSQGAAEGISTFVSAGDSGAAGCDDHGVAPPATQILSTNALCSSGFVTCVGGTEFSDTANPHAYWGNINSTTHGSALGYIPEGVWNEPMTSSATTQIAAGGGGMSIYIPKPAFQTGTGVPADGYRDTPDISFSSSAHDGYLGCFLIVANGACTPNPQGDYSLSQNFYGTSAAAPSMAAITALIDQKLGGAQGALNPLIYRLANRVLSTAFHDVTVTSSGISASSCTAATPSLCNNSTPGQSGLTGGLPGYLVTTGYDQATGWGSLDVDNFINAALAAGAATTTTLTGSSGNIIGTQTLTFSATVAAAASATVPTGGVQFYENGVPSGSLQPLNASSQATYSIASTALPNGAVQITASYNGDSTFEGSTSNAISLQVSPVGTAADSLVLTPSSPSVDPTMSITLTATFAGKGASAAPTAPITLNYLDAGSLVPFSSQAPTPTAVSVTLGPHLAAGPHSFVATYPGDNTYAAVTSAPLTITVTPLKTTTSLTGPVFTTSSSTITLSATVSGVLGVVLGEYTPYVQLLDGTSRIAVVASTLAVSPTGVPIATATFSPTLTMGTHSLTAVWPGDLYTSASTSAPLTVVSSNSGITVTPATQQVNLPAPGATGLDTLTISSFGGFSGSANLTCAVTYSGSLTISAAPTCSLSNPTVMLTAGGTATSVLTLSTVGSQTAADLKNDAPGRGTLVLCVVGFISTLARRKRLAASKHRRACFLALVAGACWLTLGCNSSPQAVTQQTTPATYTVNISGGSGGNMNVLSTITLTVQ
jgi:subtilase family serine protease